MSKKGFGKIITFAAILGAVAAGISYFAKYKSFHKELEEDFHDFEDEFDDEDAEDEDLPVTENENIKRNYVPIHREEDPAVSAGVAEEKEEAVPEAAVAEVIDEDAAEAPVDDNIVSFSSESNVTVSEEEE